MNDPQTCTSSVTRLVVGCCLAAALVFSAGTAWAHDETREVLEEFLHELEHAGDITEDQHHTIETMFWELGFHDQLHTYIHAQAQAGRMTEETADYLDSMFHLEHVDSVLAAAPANYTGNGNVTRLGHLDPDPGGQIYNGIWGYAVGSREYALQTNSTGVHILDVTNPASTYRVQVLPMAGGDTWRDVDTHVDLPSGKTYAYVGAQSSGNLWVVDLSYLSGTTAHGVDSNPIPPAGYVDRGRTNWGHTVSINDGLLFMTRRRRRSRPGRACTARTAARALPSRRGRDRAGRSESRARR